MTATTPTEEIPWVDAWVRWERDPTLGGADGDGDDEDEDGG